MDNSINHKVVLNEIIASKQYVSPVILGITEVLGSIIEQIEKIENILIDNNIRSTIHLSSISSESKQFRIEKHHVYKCRNGILIFITDNEFDGIFPVVGMALTGDTKGTIFTFKLNGSFSTKPEAHIMDIIEEVELKA